MQPCGTPFQYNQPAQLNQFRAGFNVEGPFIEVRYPGYPPFGVGFDVQGPYIDDPFPNWLFGSPFIGPGPFSW